MILFESSVCVCLFMNTYDNVEVDSIEGFYRKHLLVICKDFYARAYIMQFNQVMCINCREKPQVIFLRIQGQGFLYILLVFKLLKIGVQYFPFGICTPNLQLQLVPVNIIIHF